MKELLLILTLFGFSCQNETTITPIDQPGILSFSSHEDFSSTRKKISTMSDAELDKWEKEKSFVSLRSILSKAYREAEILTTEAELRDFATKYSDILTVDNENNIEPIIKIFTLHSFINREGVYETSGYLNKVIGDYVVTAKVSESNKLKDLKISDVLSKKSDLPVYKYVDMSENIIEGRITASCQTNMFATYFKNESGCRNDREVNLFAKSFVVVKNDASGTYYEPQVEIIVQPRRRSGTLCNWNGYENPTELRNTSFTIRAWRTISYSSTNTTSQLTNYTVVIPYTYQSTGNGYKWTQAIGDYTFNEPITAFPFTTLHAEGKSQGVGIDGWAIIDCQ